MAIAFRCRGCGEDVIALTISTSKDRVVGCGQCGWWITIRREAGPDPSRLRLALVADDDYEVPARLPS